ncbi:MAG: HDOD domain-containing protein [Myxococcota bacterium]
MISREELQARIVSLPTLPMAAAQLATLLRDERASAADFERIIRPDPALTANLLRMANSSFFGMRQEVTSVRRAISLLGTERIFEIAMGVGFQSVVPERIAGYEIDSAQFWLHSVAVAVLGERIAAELGLGCPDLTFTAGLLHDLGKLAIGSLLEGRETAIRTRISEGCDFASLERELLGVDHAEAGALVAEAWSLPAALIHPIAHHHEPSSCPEPSAQRIVDLVHVSDGLAYALGFGSDIGELARRIQPSVIERLGLRVQALEAVACEAMGAIRVMGTMRGEPDGAGSEADGGWG